MEAQSDDFHPQYEHTDAKSTSKMPYCCLVLDPRKAAIYYR